MGGVTLQDRETSELRQRLALHSVCVKVYRWSRHVKRKDERAWVSACIDISVAGEIERGKGRKTWKKWQECIADDTRKINLRKEDAQERGLWWSDVLRNRPTRASAARYTFGRSNGDERPMRNHHVQIAGP